jgi:hypothetical protein
MADNSNSRYAAATCTWSGEGCGERTNEKEIAQGKSTGVEVCVLRGFNGAKLKSVAEIGRKREKQ